MKKSWFLILMLSAILFAGCNKEDADSEKYPLKNTKWMCQMPSGANIVLDFTSEKDVLIYYTNLSRVLMGNVFNATYTVGDNNTVTFNQADFVEYSSSSHPNKYHLFTGIFTDRFMVVNYQEEEYYYDRTSDKDMTLAKE
ncbi:MAG: hypothetical protein LBK03_07985 [Bacteroidales bacterium]|jgi:hypothetical protein|nr:hypothetical protein [Bacteroidales bacterium]